MPDKINYLVTAATGQTGYFPFPRGEGKCPVFSSTDIAAVAVSILITPTLHIGKRYQPTGPIPISMQDMLDSFSRVLGKKVKKMPMPNFMFHIF